MATSVLKVGLAGAGHLGKVHLQCMLEIPEIRCVGFYEVNPQTIEQVERQFNVPAFRDLDELIAESDALDIVSTTSTHFEIAKRAILARRHCFIEKPVCASLEQAIELSELARGSGVQIQVGHVERFNPAFVAAKNIITNPKFIEAHRLSTFNPRGRDVSVIHDVMIHDLDLISLIAQSEVRDIRASGVSIVSPSPDICNARIEFENGMVANVTASRISMKQMRKLRIFQQDAYISLDLLEKQAQIIRLLDVATEESVEIDTYKGKRYITMINPKIFPNNAIIEELKSFRSSIVNHCVPEVNIVDGIRALKLVQAISNLIENQNG